LAKSNGTSQNLLQKKWYAKHLNVSSLQSQQNNSKNTAEHDYKIQIKSHDYVSIFIDELHKMKTQEHAQSHILVSSEQ
jgi:ubiquitin C-terminal hydrolase